MIGEVVSLFKGFEKVLFGKGLVVRDEYEEILRGLEELAETSKVVKWRYTTHIARKVLFE